MKKNKIYIITFDGFFGQKIKEFESINIEDIQEKLSNNFDVEVIDFKNLNISDLDRDAYVYATGSQNSQIRDYINDRLLALNYIGMRIVPSINHYLCHENKGLQSDIKSALNINTLNDYYAINDQNKVKISDAKVVKLNEGFASKTVSLVKSQKDFEKFIRTNTIFNSKLQDLIRHYKLKIRSLFKMKNAALLNKYYEPRLSYVIQDFVSDLTFDYKVLIFSDKYYILKRGVRNNDFRASGSGIFEFPEEVYSELLDFCESVFKKLDTPFVSIDVVEANNEFHLIEFQSIHFGPYTQIKSKLVFEKCDAKWVKYENKYSFEHLLAYSLERFIKND